jgi:hypothetical protein
MIFLEKEKQKPVIPCALILSVWRQEQAVFCCFIFKKKQNEFLARQGRDLTHAA